MGFEHKYPYSDFHELNLDWVLDVVKRLESEWPEYKTAIETEWNNYKDSLTGEGGEWPTFKAAVETTISNFIHDVVGAYNGNMNYQPGMFCYYEGNVYKCMTGSSAAFPRPFNSYNWFSYANQDTNSIVNDLYNYLSTELSSQNTKIYNWIMNTAAQWDSETSYVAGDYCSAIVGGFGVPPTWRYFKCLQDCTNIDVLDTDYWEEVVFASDVAERIAAYKQAMQDQYDAFLEDYQRQFGVVQTTGSSTTDVMSQKAVSDELQAHYDMIDNLIKDIAPVYDSTKPYKIGILLTYLGKQYYCIADAPVGTLPTNTTYFEEKSVSDIIEMIKTGEITVGKSNLANNFDSKMVLTDNSGYLYRTTGGSLEVGEQNRVKKIVGASVPIVQLANKDIMAFKNTTTTVDGNKITITATETSSQSGYYSTAGFVKRPVGHKIMVFAKSTHEWMLSYTSTSYKNFTAGKNETIFEQTYESSYVFPFRNGATAGDTNVFDYLNIIDLTQTFGTTVANRLYVLEQAQAGAGIAKAKEILVKDYYPYNVTDFTHVKTSGKVNNKFNQWDEVTELGSLNVQTGQKQNANDRLRTKNYVEVVPNTTYYYTNKGGSYNLGYAEYDASKNYIRGNAWSEGHTMTTSENTHFLMWYIVPSYGTTYNHDMCINLHWDGERDGEYEAYQEWSYPVDNVELLGYLTLDASDNWVIEDGADTYLPSGEVDKMWTEYTFTGNESVSGPDSNSRYNVTIGSEAVFKKIIGVPECASDALQNLTEGFYASNGANGTFTIKVPSVTSGAELLTFLTGRKAIYRKQLSTSPTISSADPYTELQNDSNWGTEKWIDTRDVPMPVFSTCEYIPDLKAKLETAPESPDEDGDYIMHRENGLNSYGSLAAWLSSNGYNKLVSITGYDATKTQTLKNVHGVFTWVDDQ